MADETEADIARSVFLALAGGSSTVAQARRLQELGAVPGRGYSSGIVLSGSGRWLPSRVNAMVRNTLYAGRHEFESRMGVIARSVPGLVTEELWLAAQRAIAANRPKDPRPPREYLLRGRVFCDSCGYRFAGTAIASGSWRDFYYRCAGQLGVLYPDSGERCQSKNVPAEWIESWVLSACVAREPTADVGTFAARRALVERGVVKIVVTTIGLSRRKTARLTLLLRDGTSLTNELARRPRRSREH